MAETAKNVFSQQTLIPLSLVITFVMCVAGVVVSHTTLSNKVDRLEVEMSKVEEKYMTREMANYQYETIRSELMEIKAILKNK